ncbi:MAG TPA: hypothetical protein VJ225_01995 [Nitrososphaeraceae archaeon]|nr:hypothetical protein [Nitrososphaeraceae archaeon]
MGARFDLVISSKGEWIPLTVGFRLTRERKHDKRSDQTGNNLQIY